MNVNNALPDSITEWGLLAISASPHTGMNINMQVLDFEMSIFISIHSLRNDTKIYGLVMSHGSSSYVISF